MNRVKIFITAVIMLILTAAAAEARTGSLLLEYDGSTHEYNGSLYELYVKNQPVMSDMEPIIFNNRALVPVREVFEEAGATVNYYADTQTVEIVEDGVNIKMNINDNIAYVNGEKTPIPDAAVPKLISKAGGLTKTMVPVRFISETIGMNVEFDGYNDAILIDSASYDELKEAAAAPDPTPEPEPSKPKVVDLSYSMVEDNKIAIKVHTDSPVNDYSYMTMEAPERLVVDLPYTELAVGEQSISVNAGGIRTVRMGQNSERARTVVDVDSLVSYGFEADGNDLIIYVRAQENPDAQPEQVQPTPEPEPSEPENVPIEVNRNLIVIDAGHGGSDPGAIGTLNGERVNESDLTLQIAYKVKSILESAGYTVLMTREDDTYKTLVERPTLANDYHAAIFVSIHINSADPSSANGTEVYYAASNNGDSYGVSSSQLAKNILNRMLAYMGSVNRGVKTAEHAVTKRTDMPSCLVEVGFISNSDELSKMVDETYQYQAAQGIAEGIIESAAQIN
ncbi:MAG: N-acetylmuramoyl-L-alanine amidase family protein [Clostridiales bacterium]|nr:N-acetylmuramoyl-L-alanine amidase family protein [Clostridiales bacterium]